MLMITSPRLGPVSRMGSRETRADNVVTSPPFGRKPRDWSSALVATLEQDTIFDTHVIPLMGNDGRLNLFLNDCDQKAYVSQLLVSKGATLADPERDLYDVKHTQGVGRIKLFTADEAATQKFRALPRVIRKVLDLLHTQPPTQT